MASSPYQRIAAELREQITAGRLRPGDQLPAVTELASGHGVSVGTAHRAVALLTAEGLVSVVRGRRAIVAHPRDKNSTDIPVSTAAGFVT
ncbi:winged helix-turn-helix domain-containing protein [Micromonospora sp. RTGN7]|uniref:winged helix-turn-helix domain-containing protein n=1 Tax=Micromonospora sp. RTGN7 TaxID=3016526 RepID=UPI0029FF3040|nr:winged helix-turn-helix domain-containing protein [Micromonospora sp. RTGN7]